MLKAVSWVFSLMMVCSSVSASERDVDFSKPESVAMHFMQALQTGAFESVPALVVEEDLRFFTPEKLKKALSHLEIPEDIKLTVKFSDNGKRAGVAVVGTEIGLELRLVDGRWLLER